MSDRSKVMKCLVMPRVQTVCDQQGSKVSTISIGARSRDKVTRFEQKKGLIRHPKAISSSAKHHYVHVPNHYHLIIIPFPISKSLIVIAWSKPVSYTHLTLPTKRIV